MWSIYLQIVLQEKLETVTEYVIRGLDQCQTWVLLDLLRALGVLVYENAGRLTQVRNYSECTIFLG